MGMGYNNFHGTESRYICLHTSRVALLARGQFWVQLKTLCRTKKSKVLKIGPGLQFKNIIFLYNHDHNLKL